MLGTAAALLEKEERRLQRELTRQRAGLAPSPGGALAVKTIHGRRYAYLVRRLGGRVRYFYQGPAASPEAAALARTVRERRDGLTLVRRMEKELVRLQKALAPLRWVAPAPSLLEARRKLPVPISTEDLGEIGGASLGSMALLAGRRAFSFDA